MKRRHRYNYNSPAAKRAQWLASIQPDRDNVASEMRLLEKLLDEIGDLRTPLLCQSGLGLTLRNSEKLHATQAYVYVIIVDGTLRYIGKGRGGRLFAHRISAERSASRCGANTAHLYPRLHRRLVDAIRAGSKIVERVIALGLSDAEAYRFESRLIVDFHRVRTGQLWNTIDERFMSKSTLPKDWTDPENPLYRLSRPIVRDMRTAIPTRPNRPRAP